MIRNKPLPLPSFVDKKGEVTHITSFIGAFVERHTAEEARSNAWALAQQMGRPMGVYRIELIEVFEPTKTG